MSIPFYLNRDPKVTGWNASPGRNLYLGSPTPGHSHPNFPEPTVHSFVMRLWIVLALPCDQHISWLLSDSVRFCFSLWLVKVTVLSSSPKEVPKVKVYGIPPIWLLYRSHFSDGHRHGAWCLARPMKRHPLLCSHLAVPFSMSVLICSSRSSGDT